MKFHRLFFSALVIASALFWFNPAANADIVYSFQTWDNTGDPAFNQLLGINNAGTIAGYFGDGTMQPNQGYTLARPSYTNENFPGSVQTQVVAISNNLSPAVTAGFYIDMNGNNFGFVDQGGVFTTVSDPLVGTVNGVTTNQLLGVNDNGVAAGFYIDGNGNSQGYLYSFLGTPTFTPVVLPGAFNAVSTAATGINDGGVIGGFFTDGGGVTHGFIEEGGTFTQLDDPNGTNTMLLGLNNEGQFVGSYVDGDGVTQGFVYNIGSNTWQTISDPNASGNMSFGVTGTTVNGINDAGALAGFYSDGIDGVNGFVAAPVPEPASFGMMALAAVYLAIGRRFVRAKR